MQKTTQWLLSFKSSQTTNNFLSNKDNGNRKAITVAVTAGKGGVGKTSFALKLAKELSAQGEKCLLIDCDYNLSNTSIKMGLPLDNKFWDLISGQKSFHDCLYKNGNLHLLPACNGSFALLEEKIELDKLIIDIVASHENEYDYIILDTSAGIQKSILNLTAYCAQRIFIVTPDRSSITDSYSMIKILGQHYGIKENSLVVNMYQDEEQLKRVIKVLTETIENFLSIRSTFLGGIRKYQGRIDEFDTFFLEEKKSQTHQDFLKLLKNFTERYNKSIGTLGLKHGEVMGNTKKVSDVTQPGW